MIMLFVEAVGADGPSASVIKVSVLLVLLSLYRKSRLYADVIHIYQGRRPLPMSMIMMSAFGEILDGADSADGARPSLSGTHYGLQRRCSARVGKRSAVSGSPAELASPIRLGQRGTSLRQSRCGSPISKGKRYGRQWPAEPSTDSHLVYPPNPQGR